MSTRPIPPFLRAFVKTAEARRLKAYPDSGKVWSIGYGHTGSEVREGLVITQTTADAYLDEDLATAAGKLAGVVDEAAILALSSNQYGALVDFVFNTGANPHWTIWQVVNAGRLGDVPGEMRRFVYVHDRETGKAVLVPGLEHRREAECAMFVTPDPADLSKLTEAPPPAVAIIVSATAEGVVLPSSGLTRTLPTPPKPSGPKGVGALWTGLTAGLACLPQTIESGRDVVKQVIDAVSPYADGANSHIKVGLSALMTLGAVLAAASVVLSFIQLRRRNR